MSNRRVLRRVAPPFAPKEKEGGLKADGLRFTIICARWNPTVTDALLRAALSTLEEHGARASDVEVVRVPGVFEIPAAAAAAARGRRGLDALIALGAIVRGETTHHEVLAHAVAAALASLSTQCPIGFGVLTCDTLEQARARSAKGVEAAEAAIEMANLCLEFGHSGAAKGGRRMARGQDVGRDTRTVARQLRSPDHPIARSPDRRRR